MGNDTELYFGPCPGPGTGLHHYVFTIVATDIEPGELIYKYSNSGGQGTWDGSEAFPDIWRKVMISGDKMTINDVFARFK